MKTIHASWELENIGADTYEITMDAQDAPELLEEEERRLTKLCLLYTSRCV